MLAGMGIHFQATRPAARHRRTAHRLGSAAVVPVVAGAAISVQPAAFGLSTVPVVLHAVSFRGPLALGLGAAGVGTLLSIHPWTDRLLSGRAERRSPGAPVRRLIGGGALLAAAIAHAAILVRRGWAAPGSGNRADLVVVSLNTLCGMATPEDIAEVVRAELATAGAAMVALPETPEPLARRCVELLAAAGHRFQMFSTTADPDNPLSVTSLLISAHLGDYRQVAAPTMLLGAVLAEPVDGPGPVLAAVHPGAPMPTVGFRTWRSDGTAAVGISRDHPFSIVAGDFNTTVDHAMMRSLEPAFDAATRAHRGAEGTWPARLPALLASPIDHVLVNGDLRVLGTRTLRVGNSDHRAVIVRLTGLPPTPWPADPQAPSVSCESPKPIQAPQVASESKPRKPPSEIKPRKRTSESKPRKRTRRGSSRPARLKSVQM